jgi:ABC-type Fe3+-siderophore transport system permease subunit
MVYIDWSQTFYHFELPRIILSIWVGAALALAGVATQALFHNPLAEPGVLGIASGASLCTLMGLLLLPVAWHQPIWVACLTGLGAASVAAVLFVVWHYRVVSPLYLLLTGVLVNAFCGGCIQILTLLMNGEMIRGWLFWSAGQLGNASWSQVGIVWGCTSLIGIILWQKARALDTLLLGEAVAYSLGVSPRGLQCVLLLSAALLIAVTLAVCGQVGFVGLIAPHLARLWRGGSHRQLIPTALAIGALLLASADWMSQHLLEGSELPLGSLTTLMGVPILIHALSKQKEHRGKS